GGGAVLDFLLGNRVGESRPSGSRLELVLRDEQVVAAADALVDTLFVAVPVLARERPLGSLLPGDGELLGRELLSPVLLRLHDMIDHDVSLLVDGVDLDLAGRCRPGGGGGG